MSDPSAALDPRVRLRGLIAAIACISVFGITLGMGGPLIALVLESRGHGSGVIGMNAAMTALGILLMSPIIPKLTARFGARPFLVLCLVVDVICFLVLPAFEALPVWFLGRFLMGAAASGLFVVSEAWINHLADDRHRGALLAIYTTCLSIGFAIGPSVLTFTGIQGWLPFLTAVAFLIVAILPVGFAGASDVGLGGKPSTSYMKFFRLAPRVAAAALLAAFYEMASGNLLPVFGISNGLDASESALLVAAVGLGGVLLPLPIGILSDRFGRIRMMGLCAFFTGVATLVLPFMLGYKPFLYTTLAIAGGCGAGIYTCALAAVGERFKGGDLVQANAGISLLWGLGSLVGPAVAGLSMEVAPRFGLPGILAGGCALFLVLFVFRGVHLSGRGA